MNFALIARIAKLKQMAGMGRGYDHMIQKPERTRLQPFVQADVGRSERAIGRFIRDEGFMEIDGTDPAGLCLACKGCQRVIGRVRVVEQQQIGRVLLEEPARGCCDAPALNSKIADSLAQADPTRQVVYIRPCGVEQPPIPG